MMNMVSFSYYSNTKPLNPHAPPYTKQPWYTMDAPAPLPHLLPQASMYQVPPVFPQLMNQRFSHYCMQQQQPPMLLSFLVVAPAPLPCSPPESFYVPSECLQDTAKVEPDDEKKNQLGSVRSLPSKLIKTNEKKLWAPKAKTTLMIKNIPNQFQRHALLPILDQFCMTENQNAKSESGHRSEYDFLYLPMDFRRRANLGYAFVNFTNAAAAVRFQQAFHKFKWNDSKTKKMCEITYANIQGSEALKKHFKSSVFQCHTDDYLPVFLSPPRDGSSPSSSKVYVIGRRGAAASGVTSKSLKSLKSLAGGHKSQNMDGKP